MVGRSVVLPPLRRDRRPSAVIHILSRQSQVTPPARLGHRCEACQCRQNDQTPDRRMGGDQKKWQYMSCNFLSCVLGVPRQQAWADKTQKRGRPRGHTRAQVGGAGAHVRDRIGDCALPLALARPRTRVRDGCHLCDSDSRHPRKKAMKRTRLRIARTPLVGSLPCTISRTPAQSYETTRESNCSAGCSSTWQFCT